MNKLNIDTKFKNGNTEFLFLRKSDFSEIFDMLQDEEVCKYLFFAQNGVGQELVDGYFGPVADGLVESLKDGKFPENAIFVVRDVNTKEFLGTVGITPVFMVSGNYEIGYQVTKESWGKGLGFLAGEMIINYAFNYLNADRVTADMMDGNMGSKKILTKLGLLEEGTQPEYYSTQNERVAKVHFGGLRKYFSKNYLARLKEKFVIV